PGRGNRETENCQSASSEPAGVGQYNKAVVLVPIAAGLAIVLQFEVALFKPHAFRGVEAVIGILADGVDHAAIPDQMSTTGVLLPPDANAKTDWRRRSVLGHGDLARSIDLPRG